MSFRKDLLSAIGCIRARRRAKKGVVEGRCLAAPARLRAEGLRHLRREVGVVVHYLPSVRFATVHVRHTPIDALAMLGAQGVGGVLGYGNHYHVTIRTRLRAQRLNLRPEGRPTVLKRTLTRISLSHSFPSGPPDQSKQLAQCFAAYCLRLARQQVSSLYGCSTTWMVFT